MSRATALQSIDPVAQQAMRESLKDLYGLEGTVFEQYVNFWSRFLRWDLGPSFSSFPMSVNDIINNAILWTVVLLTSTVILSWFIGLILGSLAGYYQEKKWSKIIENINVVIYPIPAYIIAFILLMTFAYYLPIFPLVGGSRGEPGFSLPYILSLFEHSFLPALSIIIGAVGLRFIFSLALAVTEMNSDHVQYAEIASLPKKKILYRYVVRNTMLPQITDLGMNLATIFEGALITEVVFGYPGIGYALYRGIISADYNLIMGVTLLSIIAIAIASLIIDLIYPFFDPRVRYK
jgi:peptide/nickel transport system permease protein